MPEVVIHVEPFPDDGGGLTRVVVDPPEWNF